MSMSMLSVVRRIVVLHISLVVVETPRELHLCAAAPTVKF